MIVGLSPGRVCTTTCSSTCYMAGCHKSVCVMNVIKAINRGGQRPTISFVANTRSRRSAVETMASPVTSVDTADTTITVVTLRRTYHTTVAR